MGRLRQSREDALVAEVEILKKLVLRVAIAAVDPASFGDVNKWVAEVFGFAELAPDMEPPDQDEIDELTAIVLKEYDFDGSDSDGDEDGGENEDGGDKKDGGTDDA